MFTKPVPLQSGVGRVLCIPCGILNCDGLETLLTRMKTGYFTPAEVVRVINGRWKTYVKDVRNSIVEAVDKTLQLNEESQCVTMK